MRSEAKRPRNGEETAKLRRGRINEEEHLKPSRRINNRRNIYLLVNK